MSILLAAQCTCGSMPVVQDGPWHWSVSCRSPACLRHSGSFRTRDVAVEAWNKVTARGTLSDRHEELLKQLDNKVVVGSW